MPLMYLCLLSPNIKDHTYACSVPCPSPQVDQQAWFTGGHLGGQIQRTNWQVVNCTTPANYFHVLRRQVSREEQHYSSQICHSKSVIGPFILHRPIHSLYVYLGEIACSIACCNPLRSGLLDESTYTAHHGSSLLGVLSLPHITCSGDARSLEHCPHNALVLTYTLSPASLSVYSSLHGTLCLSLLP